MSLTFVQQSLETSRGSFRCWGWAAPASQWTISAPAPSGLLLSAPCAGQHRTSSPSSHVCPELTELCYHAYSLCSDDVGKEEQVPSFDCFCWISVIWIVLLFQSTSGSSTCRQAPSFILLSVFLFPDWTLMGWWHCKCFILFVYIQCCVNNGGAQMDKTDGVYVCERLIHSQCEDKKTDRCFITWAQVPSGDKDPILTRWTLKM